MRRLALILAALVLLWSGADARPLRGGGAASTGCDSLCTLFGTLAQGQWKLLTASGSCGESNFSCHALGFECGSPSTNGSCWCADFDGNPTVGGSVCSTGSIETTGAAWANLWYSGYPTDTPLNQATTFSAPGIRKSDGLVLFRGGGHAIPPYGGIGSIEQFSAQAAAASLCSTMSAGQCVGAGGNWSLLVAGGRLIANSNGEPSWSQQNDTACSSASPWVTTNVNGQEMVTALHTYWGTQPIPGTNKWFLGGVFDGCGASGVASSHNGALEVDSSTGNTTLFGSAAAGSIMFPGGPYDPIDGKIYQGQYGASDNTTIHTFTVSSPGAYADNPVTTAAPCNGSFAYGRAIIFPDPSDPTGDVDFVMDNWNGYNGSAGSATFVLIKHVHSIGGAGGFSCSTFPNTIPQFAVSGGEYAYDDDDGTFYWVAMGSGAMYHMVLNFTTFSSSTITAVSTTPSGDVPNCTNPSGGTFAGVEYLPASRPSSGGRAGVLLSCNGLVWARAAPF